MSGESGYAEFLIQEAMEEARARPSFCEDAMGRALINSVIQYYRLNRSGADIASELQFLAETIDDTSPVITRGG